MKPISAYSPSISILGGGAWGTALANFLACQNKSVNLWIRNPSQYADIISNPNFRCNTKYLPNISLDNRLNITDNLSHACQADIIILATPCNGLVDIINNIHGNINEDKHIVYLCKGFILHDEQIYLPSQLIEKLKCINNIGILTGPSFAAEVAQNLPFALTIASKSNETIDIVQNTMHGDLLRIYSSNDVIGCELGGALKNILAIATGISAGLNLGLNAQAALISRGIQEMMRLGVAMGGNMHTLIGLSGIGDLILTATSSLSRNRRVGEILAVNNGQKCLNNVLRELGHVAEGVYSTKYAYELARKYSVDMPLINAVYQVLFNNMTAQQAINNLLSREPKSEHNIT
jgi:glycerol-3-phosphate dehydrogenase (NAD(P)+)